MIKKLLFLLVLLLTATTGACAQGPVDGTIVWSVGGEASATVSASIKDAISSTGVTTGSGLTVSTGKYFDTDMVKYRPATANAGNVEGVMIEYTIEAVDGYKFKPTCVDYAAVKDGTDNASYSWSYTIDGVESAITDVSMNDVLRNTGSNSGTAQLMHSESITADGCSVFTLRFYISNCGTTKNICIAKITISGSVSAAASGYTVSLNDGTENPTTWTASTDGTNFGALPIGGLKGDGSETVTLKYSGSKKVIGVKAEKKAAGPNEVLTYSFDDASHPSGLTAGSRVSFDYSRTSVITNSKFLNAYNNTNGDPNATTVSLGDTDLSGETWTLSFEWAACGGCNSKPDHTTLKAGDATLFDLSGNSNWNTTVTIIYTGSDGSKALPVPGCDKDKRFTAAVGDQYNTTTYWHHIVVTGSAEGVKMTITNSSTGAAVVEDVVLSETNVNPTSLIIEPCCGGGIGIDALSLTYEE